MHICLLTDELHAAVEHLRKNGASIDREPAVGSDGNWQAWTRDPDGNEIELMQLSEESPLWRTARSAERGGQMALIPETFATACGPDTRRAGSRPRRRSC
jgi:hypothetical protein